MTPNNIPVGVVGLGLMCSRIATCLLMTGHPVVAIAPIEADLLHAEKRIKEHLTKSSKEGLIDLAPEEVMRNLSITMDYAMLSDCRLVIECTLEDLSVKKTVFGKIE